MSVTAAEAIGRRRSREARIAASDVARLAAVLGREEAPARLPPAWTWAVLTEAAPQASIGADGHPKLGDFLPRTPYPRRMFAGATLEFQRPLAVDVVTRLDEAILSVAEKSGRSGSLLFVEVERLFSQMGEPCVREVQTLVYREAASGPAEPVASAGPEPDRDWADEQRPDETLLFRFSAATFNAHRIHYDRDYARTVEFYPDLVVHGPLIALLLLESFSRRHPEAEVARFRFQAKSPLFLGAPFRTCGRAQDGGFALFALGPHGETAMEAKLDLVGS